MPSHSSSIKIQLVRSPIGYNERHKKTVRALGLRRLNQVVERPDNPAIRGMIAAIIHMVKVSEA